MKQPTTSVCHAICKAALRLPVVVFQWVALPSPAMLEYMRILIKMTEGE